MIQQRFGSIGRVWIAASLALICVAILASATSATGKTRALGGVRLVEAMEGAPLCVVAEVAALRALGGTGYAASLLVETALRDAFERGEKLKPGDPIEIAWEELSPARAPRFRTGERVLVALEALGGASIWISRIPDASLRQRTLAVAMNGDAFLRSPSQASVLVLEHYLALPSVLREGEDGSAYLARLAASAEIPLASDAVARLGTRAKLGEWVVADVAEQLMAALLRPDAPPALQDALVDLIARRELVGLRAPLTALATSDTLAPPVVYAALAALDGGLDARVTEKLLALGPGPYREVVARHAGGADAELDLRALIASDPSPEVRSLAIERLATLRGEAAAPLVAEALYDRESLVRGAAARQLGLLGDPAIATLQQAVDSSNLDAARAAVAGLSIIGTPESSSVLVEIAATHPEESIRQLATLAIGGKVGDD